MHRSENWCSTHLQYTITSWFCCYISIHTMKLWRRNGIVTCRGDCWWGFELNIKFIDHLQVLTTNNCNTIADFHTLQITTPYVFASRSLATAYNSGDSLGSCPQNLFHRLPYISVQAVTLSLAYNISARTTWKTALLLCLNSLPQICVYYADLRKHLSSFAVPLLYSCLVTCLPYPPISRSLNGNSSTRYSTVTCPGFHD
jgi:hypothetical protein